MTTRSNEAGLRGKLSSLTIKKELATLRTLWNWAKKEELVNLPFPYSGLIFPKETEKPPFQTWNQIERQIS
ncbi:hypothetical protein [uncultured Rubinisphaera sp.]|uniref:hypothetical protein n=1 Tax=uncultured Rubinisphaera sp. TaxID=1678686 RepID=UPI0030DB7F99